MTWPHCTRREPLELALQRIAFAVVVFVYFLSLRPYAAQPFPVGIARYVDFSFFANESVRPWLYVGLVIALLLYVGGRVMPLAVAVMLFLWVGAGALANSQGALAHYTQLVALVLIAQLIAYGQSWLMRRRTVPAADAYGAHDLATYYTVQVMAAAYLLAGMMKILLSRGQWLAQVPFIASDVLKTHGQAYASSLTEGAIARGDLTAAFVLTHPILMRVLLGGGLLFELAAPLALFGRRSALLVGLGLLGMHVAIDHLMLIRFPENAGMVLVYFVNVPYLVAQAASHRSTKKTLTEI